MTTATTQTPDEARAQVLNQFKGLLGRAIDAQDGLSRVILGQGFIVQTGSEMPVSLTFDIRDGFAENPRNALPWEATRFTRRDAGTVAANVKNGNGETGRPVSVKDAVHTYIGTLQELITTLETA